MPRSIKQNFSHTNLLDIRNFLLNNSDDNGYLKINIADWEALTTINTDDINTHSNLEIINNTLNSVINTNNTTATNKTVLVSGVHNSNLNTVSSGESKALFVANDGSLVARLRCQQQTLIDGVNNTERLPLSCDGGFIATPVFPFMFNGSTWDRLRGNSTNGLLSYDTTVNTSINNANTSINTKLDNLITNIPKTLRQYREEGNCFSVTNSWQSLTSNYIALYLNNASGSGKNYYIYNFEFSFKDDQNTARDDIFIIADDALTSSYGTTVNYTNLNTLSAVSGTNKTGYNPTRINVNETIITRYNSMIYSLGIYSDFQEEFIKIPPGKQVFIMMNNGTGSGYYTATIRWVEEDI